MSEPIGTPTTAAPPSPLATPGPWDLVAAGYEEATRPYLARFSAVGLERLGLQPTQRMLDVACGPGTTTLLAAPRVLHVDALDFSVEMLGQARQNVEKGGLGNVTLHEGDGQNLPFAAESFDCAVSMFGLMFFPDRARGQRELCRVLRPGGKVLLSSWAPLAESPLMNALFAAVRIFDPSRPAPQADIASLENPRVFEAELLAAGFTDVTVETVAQELEFTSAQDVWREMAKGSVPLVLLRRSVGETVWREKEPLAIAAMADAIGDRRALASLAHLAFGTKA